MKELLQRKKWTILFFLVVIIFSFVLIPTEKSHYSKESIEKFKDQYYWRVMTYVSITVVIFIVLYKKLIYQEFNEILKTFLKMALVSVLIVFLLQNFFITLILLGNRQYAKERICHEFIVYYKMDDGHFFAKNSNSNEVISDLDFLRLSRKSKSEIEKIKLNDTVKIKTNKGIFGIEFY